MSATKTLTHHAYQWDMVEYMVNNRRCNVFAAMGLGKSSSVLTAIGQLSLVEDIFPVLILGPLRVANSTWPDEVAGWTNYEHLTVSVVTGTLAERKAALAVKADIYTMNYDNLVWLDAYLPEWPFKMIVPDECFVSGTRVSTPNGFKEIQNVEVGDIVVTPLGPRAVTSTFVKKAEALVRLHLSDGTEVVCTPTHRFRVENRWVEAAQLSGLPLVCPQGVQALPMHVRGGCGPIEVPSFGCDVQPLMLNEAVDVHEDTRVALGDTHSRFEQMAGCKPAVEQGRPHTHGNSIENIEGHVEARGPIHGSNTRGERSRDVTGRDSAGSTLEGGLGMEPSDKDATPERAGLSESADLLQTRLCMASDNDVLGGGRHDPRVDRRAEEGCQERGRANCVRVDRVENIELGCTVDVFDIEVDGAHCFYAGGVLVHNCSKLKGFRTKQGAKRAQVLSKHAHKPGMRYVGLTGTPAANGLSGLWGIMHFVDRGERLGKSFTAFSERWFRDGFDGFKLEPLAHSQTEIQGLIADRCVALNAADYFDLLAPVVTMVPVAMPLAARRHYDEMEDDMFTTLRLAAELAKSKGQTVDVEAFSAGGKMMNCRQLANGALYTDDKKNFSVTYDGKIDALQSIVEESMGAPLLVAYHFKSDLARLKKAFPKARVLDKKPQTIKDWNKGKIDMLFAHAASAGHGLNLAAGGNTIVYFSFDWNLEEHQQILERIGPVRQAQINSGKVVFVYFLVATGTVDDQLITRLDGKKTVQQVLMDALKHRKDKRK